MAYEMEAKYVGTLNTKGIIPSNNEEIGTGWMGKIADNVSYANTSNVFNLYVKGPTCKIYPRSGQDYYDRYGLQQSSYLELGTNVANYVVTKKFRFKKLNNNSFNSYGTWGITYGFEYLANNNSKYATVVYELNGIEIHKEVTYGTFTALNSSDSVRTTRIYDKLKGWDEGENEITIRGVVNDGTLFAFTGSFYSWLNIGIWP